MPEDRGATEALAERIKAALESADPAAFLDLLDPDVRWGAPDDPTPSCQNRDQVIAWYQHGRAEGVQASVTEVVVAADKLLVGLKVRGNDAAAARGGEVDRWQVLTVGDGRVVDIRAFDERGEAAARAGLPG